MKSGRIIGLVAVGLCTSVAGCGGSASGDTTAEGTRGGPCYGNSTCNAGLICVAGLCVEASEAGADGATDTASGGDTAAGDAVGDLAPGDAPPGDVAPGDSADAATDTAPAPPYKKSDLTAAACDDVAGFPDVPGAAADDSTSGMAALPFAFQFFGAPVTTFSASSNGFAQLWPASGGTPSSKPDNVSIPTAADPGNLVAPFWDDLVPVFSNMKAGALGTTPNRRFVLAWSHWAAKGAPATRLTFQAKLFEGTNVIEFHYCSLEGTGLDAARATGSSATVGLENAGGTVGIQASFDTGSLKTGMALRFTP